MACDVDVDLLLGIDAPRVIDLVLALVPNPSARSDFHLGADCVEPNH